MFDAKARYDNRADNNTMSTTALIYLAAALGAVSGAHAARGDAASMVPLGHHHNNAATLSDAARRRLAIGDDWVINTGYAAKCVLGGWIPGVCKCPAYELIGLYNDGKLNPSGGTAAVITQLMGDKEVLNALCKDPGCAGELLNDGLNYGALGITDPSVVAAVKDLGSPSS